MRSAIKFALCAAVSVGIGAVGFAALAQKDPKVGTLATDPVGPTPDPTRVTATLPKDQKCTGTEGKQTMCILYGDPTKAGPYMVKYTWWPGNFSKPHYHTNERFAYIVSGTWWTSSSSVYDERTTYPVHAGTVAVDKLNGIHWDGSRTGEKEPAVLILAGTGPNITYNVDEQGKPVGPPR